VARRSEVVGDLASGLDFTPKAKANFLSNRATIHRGQRQQRQYRR
jgi:hypothetical protein